MRRVVVYGAFWRKAIGCSAGKARIVVEHATRIDPTSAPHWPQPDDAHVGGVGEHRVRRSDPLGRR